MTALSHYSPTRAISRAGFLPLLLAVVPAMRAQDAKLDLPPRPADAPTGSQFLKQIESLAREGREAATLQQITHGNIPAFLRITKGDRSGSHRLAG